MKRAKLVLASLALSCTSGAFAQYNLVPNGGFEEQEKKIKAPAQIQLATGWSSPNDKPADLFHVKAKHEGYGIPQNAYGREEAETGDGYAGIVMYSDKNRVPKSHLQTELKEPLVKGKIYCAKFYVSMSDLSKYQANNMGMYLSATKPTREDIDKKGFKPQIAHSKNIMYEEMGTWIPVCRAYQAAGGEKFLTIGNFDTNENTTVKKVKRPKGFSKPQKPIAYYFIESVLITPLDSIDIEDCTCEKTPGLGRMNIVYSQNVSDSADMKDNEKIAHINVFFDKESATISATGKTELNKLAGMLTMKEDIKLEIAGHVDNIEATGDVKTLSDDRAKAVREYLIGRSIHGQRLTIKDAGTSAPMDKSGTAESRSKNRRVSFKQL